MERIIFTKSSGESTALFMCTLLIFGRENEIIDKVKYQNLRNKVSHHLYLNKQDRKILKMIHTVAVRANLAAEISD